MVTFQKCLSPLHWTADNQKPVQTSKVSFAVYFDANQLCEVRKGTQQVDRECGGVAMQGV